MYDYLRGYQEPDKPEKHGIMRELKFRSGKNLEKSGNFCLFQEFLHSK